MTGSVEASEFIEEEFISAIERQLEKHTYSHWVTISRISQSAEKHLGYDGVLTSALPFYVQFKRSTLYREAYSGKLAKDRSAPFGVNKFFYGFELHKDGKSGLFEQHNALHALSARFPAAYVAPLFHRKTQLTDYKTRKAPSAYPWYYHNGVIHDGPAGFVYRSRIFDMTAAIAPHKRLPTADPSHHYTYNRKLEVCFHSTPEPLEQARRSFSGFLSNVMRSFEEQRDDMPRVGNVAELVETLFPREQRSSLGRFVRMHVPTAESWQAIYELPTMLQLAILEDVLWETFGIRQYVVHGAAV